MRGNQIEFLLLYQRLKCNRISALAIRKVDRTDQNKATEWLPSETRNHESVGHTVSILHT
jgi:hypothetical protein